MSDPLNEPICTRSTSLPAPTRTVEIAAEYLAHTVHEDMGTLNGKTALYWHLINVIQQHAGRRTEACN